MSRRSTGAVSRGLALALLVPAASARAQAPVPPAGAEAPEAAPGPALSEPAALERPRPPENHWLPALEIVGWNLLQNRWSYYAGNRAVYDVGLSSWGGSFRKWWWDRDSFTTNELAHPYMGSLYFNMARSSGLPFWESFGYAFGGSLMWESFGETEPPAFDDQISTSWGGAIIGEVLFRLSNRLLDGGGGRPGFWRELGALVLDPAQGLNRILYGNRFRPAEPELEPFYAELRTAAGVASTSEGGVTTHPAPVLAAGVRVVNGVPGGDLRFREPFDHFDASLTFVVDRDALRSPSFSMVLLRGAVAAATYGGPGSGGLWGLYFDYDYVSPAVYRASSSNLGLGTTAQVDWGSWAFQGHALLGAGFGAGGSSVALESRDYHFGGQVVAQLETTFFWRDRLRFRSTSRGYFTSGKLTDQHHASEDIEYSILSVDWRISGRNAVGIESVGARRRATYPGAPKADSRVSSLVILYELLGDAGMGRGR